MSTPITKQGKKVALAIRLLLQGSVDKGYLSQRVYDLTINDWIDGIAAIEDEAREPMRIAAQDIIDAWEGKFPDGDRGWTRRIEALHIALEKEK